MNDYIYIYDIKYVICIKHTNNIGCFTQKFFILLIILFEENVL